MAQALLLPLIESEDVLPERIFAVVGSDSSVKSRLKHLPKGIQVVSRDDDKADQVWNSDVQLLAVKPHQLEAVEIKARSLQKKNGSTKPLLISLLAGTTLGRLMKVFPQHMCVRAVPNMPSIVRAGLTGLAFQEGLSDKQKNFVMQLFNPISESLELPEGQLDAFLALTSSGPAYIALIAEALADGAVAAGLPRDLSNYLSHRMLFGSALLLKEKGLHPAELKDLVASPGGTTIAALRHLEKVGLRSALIEAVAVAAERSRELSSY